MFTLWTKTQKIISRAKWRHKMKVKEGLLDYLTTKQQGFLFWFIILTIVGADIGLIIGQLVK